MRKKRRKRSSRSDTPQGCHLWYLGVVADNTWPPILKTKGEVAMKKEDDIRIVDVDGEKRAQFEIEVEITTEGILRSSSGVRLIDTNTCPCLYPIATRAVKALKEARAAQNTKFEVGKWYKRSYTYPVKVVKIENGEAHLRWVDDYSKTMLREGVRKKLDGRKLCDPPTPDFMTAEELKRRFNPTGNLLEDTKLALKLSIEKWKRNKVWVELLGFNKDNTPPYTSTTCALCQLFERTEYICPLERSNNAECTGTSCAPDYYKARASTTKDFLYGFVSYAQDLVDLMETKLAEVNEQLRAPETLEQYGCTYKRVDKVSK